MHSRTIVLAVGLLAAPLSLMLSPEGSSLRPSRVWIAAASAEESVNGHVLTAAPVPGDSGGGRSPADRVAGAGSRTMDAGPTNSTPFSSTPTGATSGGGDQVSQRDRSLTPFSQSGVIPNLGR